MVTININRLRELKEQQKTKPTPRIHVTIINPDKADGLTGLISHALKMVDDTPFQRTPPILNKTTALVEFQKIYDRMPQADLKKSLVDKCWSDYNDLHLERKKLSNQIFDLVESGASADQLSEHYAKIESYRPGLQELFDKARHVQQYGLLPEVKLEPKSSMTVLELKDQKRKLTDQRCKLKAKIKKGHKNPIRVTEWQIELDQAEVEYKHTEEELKKIEGKA